MHTCCQLVTSKFDCSSDKRYTQDSVRSLTSLAVCSWQLGSLHAHMLSLANKCACLVALLPPLPYLGLTTFWVV